jgi:hypothetical protein
VTSACCFFPGLGWAVAPIVGWLQYVRCTLRMFSVSVSVPARCPSIVGRGALRGDQWGHGRGGRRRGGRRGEYPRHHHHRDVTTSAGPGARPASSGTVPQGQGGRCARTDQGGPHGGWSTSRQELPRHPRHRRGRHCPRFVWAYVCTTWVDGCRRLIWELLAPWAPVCDVSPPWDLPSPSHAALGGAGARHGDGHSVPLDHGPAALPPRATAGAGAGAGAGMSVSVGARGGPPLSTSGPLASSFAGPMAGPGASGKPSGPPAAPPPSGSAGDCAKNSDFVRQQLMQVRVHWGLGGRHGTSRKAFSSLILILIVPPCPCSCQFRNVCAHHQASAMQAVAAAQAETRASTVARNLPDVRQR